MFILKKFLRCFLLPPGVFVLLLTFIGVWFLYKKRRGLGILNLFIACLMWAFSISPVSDAMLKALESGVAMPNNVQGDVIILLSGGISVDENGIISPSWETLSRVFTAIRLREDLKVPVIISGGKVYQHKKFVPAVFVKRLLIGLGMPAKDIIVEDKSRDTLENAKFVKEICLRLGYKRPVLVTSAYHLMRATMAFDKVGLQTTPFPAGLELRDEKQYIWKDYLPGSFGGMRTALHEYLGIIVYKLVY